MTTATRLADELGLDHPGAIEVANHLEGIPDTGVRRELAAKALADRRTALALYATLYRERYGHTLNLDKLLADDELYGDLTVLAVA